MGTERSVRTLGNGSGVCHPITIDADAFAPGTDVSTAFPGVTLAHLTFTAAGTQSSPVCSAGCTPGAAVCTALGTASFGWQNASSVISRHWNSTASYIGNCFAAIFSYCYSSPQHLLEVSLATATDFISFDSTHTSDHPYVWALDSAGNRLTVTVASATANISRIVIAGNGGASTVNGITY